MDNKPRPEKYRQLSITALVCGILVFSPFILQLGPIQPLLWGLPIAAVVCGSIDLKRIKSGLYSKKGKGFDIAGIILGAIPILYVLIMTPLTFIIPNFPYWHRIIF